MSTDQRKNPETHDRELSRKKKAPEANAPEHDVEQQPDSSTLQRAIEHPEHATPKDILHLQRRMGNRAVGRLIQRKLQVGAANDRYEQEADRVANQVVNVPSASSSESVQRLGEEEQVQTKPLADSISPLGQQQADDRQLHTKRENGDGGFEASSGFESRLAASRGGGSPLPENTRAEMESKFGADFGSVRVHTGGEAVQLNREVSAQAFTHGSDIYLGAHSNDLGSPSGKHLLAHELTHVVQQGGAKRIDGQYSNRLQRKKGDKKDDKKTDLAALLSGLTPNLKVSDEAPDDFVVTVAVAQGMPEYLQFAKKRMKSTIRNKARDIARNVPVIKGAVRNPKTGAEIKQKAASKTAVPQQKASGGQESQQEAINRVIQDSSSVGHTWIKFTTVKDDRITATYSFGFIPGGSVTDPQAAVPGVVRNPDMEFEQDSNRRYLDTPVKESKFKAGVSKAVKLKGSPPQYSTIGYNCTKFVKDVAAAAGATFPGNVGMMLPISARGLFKRALNPNAVYEKLGKNQDTESDSPENQLMESGDMVANSSGTLVNPEEAFTSKEIVELIQRHQYMVGSWEGRPDKWQEIGLRPAHLQKLTQDEMKNLVFKDDIDLMTIFETLGVPTTNVPRARGHGGGRNPYYRGF